MVVSGNSMTGAETLNIYLAFCSLPSLLPSLIFLLYQNANKNTRQDLDREEDAFFTSLSAVHKKRVLLYANYQTALSIQAADTHFLDRC